MYSVVYSYRDVSGIMELDIIAWGTVPLKYTSPFIYRGEMHFRVQKMGKLQNRKCRCALKSGNAIMSV